MDLYALHGIGKTTGHELRSLFSEAYAALANLNTKDSQLEQRIMAVVFANLHASDEQLERELTNAAARSKYFQDFYLSLIDGLKSVNGLGALPAIPALAAGFSKLQAGVNSAKNLVSNIFGGSRNRAFGTTNLRPGQVLTDRFGNSYTVGNERRFDDFIVNAPSGVSGGLPYMSDARLANDGTLYFVSRGSNRGNTGVVMKTNERGQMVFHAGPVSEFPSDATGFLDYSEFSQSQQQVMPQPMPQQFAQQPLVADMNISNALPQSPMARSSSGLKNEPTFTTDVHDRDDNPSSKTQIPPAVYWAVGGVAAAGLIGTAVYFAKPKNKSLSGTPKRGVKTYRRKNKSSPRSRVRKATFSM